MSTQAIEPIAAADEFTDLAEVIELRRLDAPSFYQRNSGSLPKSSGGMSDAHRRGMLPRPDNTDPDTMVDKIRGLFRR
jgi:hypothetical protein